MTRISQFAKDLQIPYTKAKKLIDEGRSKKDNGSIILERVTMETKKDKDKDKKKKNLILMSLLLNHFLKYQKVWKKSFLLLEVEK